MTTVYPISSATKTPNPTAATDASGSSTNQMNQDTFLKLLVAQLKYQDPMNPADSTQFLTQTAQFTQVETLQKIETELAASQSANQTLAASAMVGRQATYSLGAGGQAVAPTATSVVSIRGSLPNDAAVGSHATATTSIFTKSGARIPLTLDFTRTADGWTVQGSAQGTKLGSPLAISFDASGDHTSGDLSLPADALNGVAGTTGDWPPSGITLAFGDSNDPTRLQEASGPATVAVAEQNGNDGQTATGLVTGVHFTADGPQVVIGGQNIAFTSVTDVQT